MLTKKSSFAAPWIRNRLETVRFAAEQPEKPHKRKITVQGAYEANYNARSKKTSKWRNALLAGRRRSTA